MPTEPQPLSLADLARRAVQICDPQDSDGVLGDYLIHFEDADEPVTAIQNLEERLALRTVGEVRRDDQLAPPARLDADESLVPAGDHHAGAELELERLAAVPGGVELLAVAPRH